MRYAPLLIALACARATPTAPTASPPAHVPPPPSPAGDVVDVHWGVEVADPYRWLEDIDNSTTRSWIDAQNLATRSHLDRLPHREHLTERLNALWTYERWSLPERAGDHYFFRYNDGTQDHSSLYVSKGLDGERRLLLDPTTLSDDGTVSLASYYPSPDGSHVAYSVSDAGSDWRTWYVLDTATGERLEDTVKWSKFSSATWTADGEGFFYGRYAEPSDDFEEALSFSKVYFHRVDTDQRNDILVFETPEHPEWGTWETLSDNGKNLYITISAGTEEKTRSYVLDVGSMDLEGPEGTAGAVVIKVHDDNDANYIPVAEVGSRTLYFTDHEAPRGRLISVDRLKPGKADWVEILPQSEATLRQVQRVGDHLIASYLEDAHTVARTFTLTGEPVRTIELPGLGTANGFRGDPDTGETFFSFSSFTQPATLYRHDTETGETRVYRKPTLAYDPDDYVTTQVRIRSKDGTEVPMFINHRKGVTPDGTNPTLLYGYGGFDIPILPRFKVENLVWMELGGVYVSANLRGGGEFGREWHEAGTKLHKQNVFDDFIASAESLIATGWTRPDRLAIHGRSNGGLLVGATLLQRPELFGAAIPTVGVMDMLRYHTFTIGWAWASDYGTVEDSEAMFRYLHAYSPVHNATPAHYPATLITTSDHDDRVVPGHSFKYAAALQTAQQADDPVLIRIETRAGHGAGTPVSMLVAENTDKLSFLLDALDATPDK